MQPTHLAHLKEQLESLEQYCDRHCAAIQVCDCVRSSVNQSDVRIQAEAKQFTASASDIRAIAATIAQVFAFMPLERPAAQDGAQRSLCNPRPASSSSDSDQSHKSVTSSPSKALYYSANLLAPAAATHSATHSSPSEHSTRQGPSIKPSECAIGQSALKTSPVKAKAAMPSTPAKSPSKAATRAPRRHSQLRAHRGAGKRNPTFRALPNQGIDSSSRLDQFRRALPAIRSPPQPGQGSSTAAVPLHNPSPVPLPRRNAAASADAADQVTYAGSTCSTMLADSDAEYEVDSPGHARDGGRFRAADLSTPRRPRSYSPVVTPQAPGQSNTDRLHSESGGAGDDWYPSPSVRNIRAATQHPSAAAAPNGAASPMSASGGAKALRSPPMARAQSEPQCVQPIRVDHHHDHEPTNAKSLVTCQVCHSMVVPGDAFAGASVEGVGGPYTPQRLLGRALRARVMGAAQLTEGELGRRELHAVLQTPRVDHRGGPDIGSPVSAMMAEMLTTPRDETPTAFGLNVTRTRGRLITLLGCQHLVCAGCLQQTVLSQLRSPAAVSEELHCPCPGCHEPVAERDIRDVLTDSEYSEYCDAIVQLALEGGLIRCPNCDVLIEKLEHEARQASPSDAVEKGMWLATEEDVQDFLYSFVSMVLGLEDHRSWFIGTVMSANAQMMMATRCQRKQLRTEMSIEYAACAPSLSAPSASPPRIISAVRGVINSCQTCSIHHSKVHRVGSALRVCTGVKVSHDFLRCVQSVQTLAKDTKSTG